MELRRRVAPANASDRVHVVRERQQWTTSETAIIICDMWNRHWCKGATARVAEMAPAMNRVVSAARDKGVLIIHAPSGTMDFYEDHPARHRAMDAPEANDLPEGIDSWRQWKDEAEEKAGYPIDYSDGGCDCDPPCGPSEPWVCQIGKIEIAEADAISDSGVEIWNLLEQHGVTNVILMGVHTNLCVLGRPFGLRNLARAGKNVVLMRDLTDAMYNSRKPPHVSHFTGTDLMIEHVERYVCPTITSSVLTGKPALRFAADKRPRVVFVSAEDEYRAAETLPAFARGLELTRGLCCDILQASTSTDDPERYTILGMETLAQADLAVVFARRRAFQAEQMKYLRDFLNRGKPLIGLRTASHAFDSGGTAPAGHDEWPKFDAEVLGGSYHGHDTSNFLTIVTSAPGKESHPILKGVELPLRSNGSLYKTSPLTQSTDLLLVGAIPGQPAEPVAWTNRYKNSRIFYTSLGHPDDFANPQFRKLLTNAVVWAMGKE